MPGSEALYHFAPSGWLGTRPDVSTCRAAASGMFGGIAVGRRCLCARARQRRGLEREVGRDVSIDPMDPRILSPSAKVGTGWSHICAIDPSRPSLHGRQVLPISARSSTPSGRSLNLRGRRDGSVGCVIARMTFSADARMPITCSPRSHATVLRRCTHVARSADNLD